MIKVERLFGSSCLHAELVLRAGLRSGQTRGEDAVRRAGHIGESDAVAIRDGLGIAAVFTADAELKIRTDLASSGHAQLNQIAHAFLVDGGKRIILENAAINIGRQEGADIITRKAVGCLREVVGTEAEELSLFGNLIGDN